MNNNRERILAMMDRLADASEAGRNVSPEELCADCPELLPDLKKRMQFLTSLNQLVIPARDPFETADPSADLVWEARSAGFPSISGYEILGLVEAGGMGTVYKARNLRMPDRIVALKVSKGELANSENLARFMQEANALARCDHPNVVRVYEVGDWQPAEGRPSIPYLALEFVEGGDLEKSLSRQRLGRKDTAELLLLVARAVKHLHTKGVIHRDLKPANILIGPRSAVSESNCALGCPKVVDLGLARMLDPNDAGAGCSVLGTPAYASPEQVDGKEVVEKTDVHGLGALLYHVLTGDAPFQGEDILQTLRKVREEVPSPPRKNHRNVPWVLNRLCMRCLEKDPQSRPSVDRVIRILQWYLWLWKWLPILGLVVCVLVVSGVSAWAMWPTKTEYGAGGIVERPAEEKPLKIDPLSVLHHAVTPDGKAAITQVLGETSFSTRFNDQMSMTVTLSRPAYLYVLAFNPDGQEQLLWPAEEKNKADPLPAVAPPRTSEPLAIPRAGQRFRLNDEPRGGLQVFVVLASSRPLPPYEEWKKGRGDVGWKRHEASTKVWQADEKGTYEVIPGKGAVRGDIEAPVGAPPLADLCAKLRVGGVEAVEAVGFSVKSKGEQGK